jgi:outer membrane protein assembly factor BamB
VNTEPYDSFLLAINPLTGKTIYKHVRKTDAVKEAFDAYSSPVAFEYGGRKEILLAGGNYFTGHDAATGKELWRFEYNPDREKWRTWRTIVSPVVADDVVVCCQPRKGTKIFAVKGGSNGTLVEKDLAWVYDGTIADSPTPLYYEGDLYIFDGTRKKVLSRVDGKSGKEKWSGVVGGKNPYYASFTAGDGKMYCISDGGEAVIVAAGGDEMKVLAEHNFGGRPVRSSIAIADGKLFIRTAKKLYCIGK